MFKTKIFVQRGTTWDEKRCGLGAVTRLFHALYLRKIKRKVTKEPLSRDYIFMRVLEKYALG